MNNKLSPICLFTYNRLTETIQTLEALKNNYLASESELYIFSDGPKKEADQPEVENVRKYLRNTCGFKSIEIIETPINKGLANSILSGVNQVIEKYGKVIVLEDDLITSPNFLTFMNQALDFYENDRRIFSISGYTMDLPSLKTYNKDYYIGYRASSWGWATWKKQWENVDWSIKDFNKFKWNPIQQIKFMRGGSDMPYMLWKQMHGKIDSWAIRWCYHQFQNDQTTLFPSISKIINIGFGDNATHTKRTKRFFTPLDSGGQINFSFDPQPKISIRLNKEFKNKFSVIDRLKDRI